MLIYKLDFCFTNELYEGNVAPGGGIVTLPLRGWRLCENYITYYFCRGEIIFACDFDINRSSMDIFKSVFDGLRQNNLAST